jgi:hypothetical protein
MNINYFIIIGIIFFMLYSINKQSHVESFQNKNDYSVLFNKFFKNNKDLDFKNLKDPKALSKLNNILSNQIAPIFQNVQKKAANIAALDNKLTSRIPDKKSTLKNFKVPMPEFDNLHGNKFRPKPNKNKKRSIKYSSKNKKKIKENFKKNIQTRTITNQKVCKFVTSTNKNKICPKEYPIFTGASLSSVGGNLSCNGVSVPQNPANAVAIIKNGEIAEIKVVHSGSNYTKPPRIMIKGDGKDAQAIAKMNSGKVYKILVTNKGSGYNATPYILIEKPKKKVFCNLCCKSEL